MTVGRIYIKPAAYNMRRFLARRPEERIVRFERTTRDENGFRRWTIRGIAESGKVATISAACSLDAIETSRV